MPNLKYLFYALRPKHWIKNFFIFSPLIFGQKLFEAAVSFEVAVAFLLFCMASSSVYLVNDIIDYERDRIDPTKRLRPIASGKVRFHQALPVAAALGIVSLLLSYFLNPVLMVILVIYLLFNFLYTHALKHLVIIDVFCLSFFFILRILAGTYVARVELSHWNILMTGLLALFLGFNKRRQELEILGTKSIEHRFVLTKYNRYFIEQMVGSNHMMFTVPFVYYGIFRYLYLLHKRRWDGDATRLLLSDLPMKLNVALWLLTAVLVIYFKI